MGTAMSDDETSGVDATKDDAKWQRVLADLVRRTEEGSLGWRTDEPVQLARSESLTTPVYVTRFDRWRLAVYGFQFKHWYEEERYEWIDAVSVEIIDDAGRPEWRLPASARAWDLIDVVGRSHAGADGLAKAILGTEQ